MVFRRFIASATRNPKSLFLIDGFGALLSSFLLGVVLVNFQSVFGIPVPTLYFLAFLPAVFALYDFFCFVGVEKNIGLFLKIIACLNIAYCFVSLVCAIYHYNTVTVLGWAYLIVEIVVVLLIAKLELKVVAYISQKSHS